MGYVYFGRNWKFHDDEQDSFDADTAPCMRSIRDSGKAIEVVALKCLVELIMNSDDTVPDLMSQAKCGNYKPNQILEVLPYGLVFWLFKDFNTNDILNTCK